MKIKLRTRVAGWIRRSGWLRPAIITWIAGSLVIVGAYMATDNFAPPCNPPPSFSSFVAPDYDSLSEVQLALLNEYGLCLTSGREEIGDKIMSFTIRVVLLVSFAALFITAVNAILTQLRGIDGPEVPILSPQKKIHKLRLNNHRKKHEN